MHQFLNPQVPAEQVVRDPIAAVSAAHAAASGRISEPPALYAPERRNSAGEDFGDPAVLAALESELRARALERSTPVLDRVAVGLF